MAALASSPSPATAPSPSTPSDSFVAVAAGPGDDGDRPAPSGEARRSVEERLRERASREVAANAGIAAGATLCVGLALALTGWLFDLEAAVAAPVTSLLVASALTWSGGRPWWAATAVAWRAATAGGGRATPTAAGRVTTATLLSALAFVAAASWMTGPLLPAGWHALIAGGIAALALVFVWSSAPMPLLAAVASALPLATGLRAWLLPPPSLDAWSSAAAASSFESTLLPVLASAVLGLLTWAEHRRWRAATLATIDADDQIAALAAARDAAIRADMEKSRFLAIASHDLRQPVHAIGLFAATLEKRLAGTAEEPLVRNLNRAIDGLDRSFNVMLDISRLDAGAVEPRVQQFPLRDLFRRLHMHFSGQAEQKGLGLRFSPGGKSVSSDPQLIERVLGNLVQNAIKYTEQGGIVVVARSTATHTHIEVWDTGVGIRAADLPKVFDEFYQVGRGERVRAQGLGMGLAIVKRLVRLMGHRLSVTSRPGRGTMFRLAIALGGLPEIQDVTAAADTLPMPVMQARTVVVETLVASDPARLAGLLEEWGYDAIAVGSIAEAEAAVDRLEAPPDLILSDLHLGDGPDGRDGIVAIEVIRDRCGADVPAMLITGDTAHAEIRRATDSGHRVLFKPVQPRKLFDALRGLGP